MRHPSDGQTGRQGGVPEVLLERARRLDLEHRGSRDGTRLLELIAKLRARRSITASDVVDVEWMLDTDAERSAMSTMVSAALVDSENGETTSALTMLSFLIEQRSPADPEVTAFVRNELETALEARGRSHQSRTKHFNHHDARSTLISAKQVFELHDRRFFLDRGTLLGAIRENGFIASDYDIDVGIFADEVSLDDIKTMFEPTDFVLNQDYEYKVGLISPTGIQVDFFLTTRERGHFLSKGFRSIHRWFFSPFDLVEYPFLGSTFYVPANYEKHLDENYGNWRDPAIFYDLSYDEPCVAYGQAAYPLGYLTRRMSEALYAGQRYYAEAPAERLAHHFDVDYTDWFPRPSVAQVKPDIPSNRAVRPIVIVDDFSVYTHRLRRVIESALSITPDIDIVVDAAAGDATAQRRVAEAIDRVSRVGAVPEVSDRALDALLDTRPRALVMSPARALQITASFADRARRAGCVIVEFDDDSMALTLDANGLVTVRQP